MGKGDKRTRRGKLFAGTFGKTRSHKPKKKAGKPGVTKKPAAPKKR